MSKAIDSLELTFGVIVKQILEALTASTGMEWICTSGRRTMKEQAALYAQGRTEPGQIVTKAQAGSSPHNYGLAADCWPMKNGKIWWSAPASAFEPLAEIAEGMGLVAGLHWRTFQDAPHIEAPNWKEQRALWQDGKIQVP